MRTNTLALAAALFASSAHLPLLAQEAKEKKAPAAPSINALAEAATIHLDKAIGLALKAREGTAVGVELEGKVVDEKVIPLFEVMVCGRDGAVYEVFVNGVDGAIVSKDACKDQEDVDEVKAIVGSVENAASLQKLVTESRTLLRGTCVKATLTAKDKQARVVMLNHGRRLSVQWSMKDGLMLGVSWLDAKEAKKAGDDDDDDGEEEEQEGEEHVGGKHGKGEEKAGKNGGSKKSKGEEEKEGEEGGVGGKNRKREKGAKGNGENTKQSN